MQILGRNRTLQMNLRAPSKRVSGIRLRSHPVVAPFGLPCRRCRHPATCRPGVHAGGPRNAWRCDALLVHRVRGRVRICDSCNDVL